MPLLIGMPSRSRPAADGPHQGTVAHVVRRFGELSECFVTELVEELEHAGWRAQVVAMAVSNRDRFPFPPDERLLRAQRPAPARRLGDRLALRSSAERRSSWLRAPLAASGAQLAHAHFGWAAADARLAARRLGLPLVATFHGSDLTAPIGRGRRRDYARLFAQLDHAIAVSSFLERKLRALGYDGPVDVIPGGVRLEQVPFRAPRAPDGPVRVLFVGRQIDCKGLDVLLRSSARLRHAGADVRLEVVGDGPARAANEALAEALALAGTVTFRGALPKDEVVAALARSDVLVAPSRTSARGQAEGRSVVAMEALAAGLPVVATDNGGLPETVPPRYRDELVPEGDDAALSDRILALIAERASWPERARAGRAWAEREFDSATLATRVAAIYSDVLDRRAERKFAVGAAV